MENIKLINILLKDASELKDLVSEIKNTKKYQSLEMDFLHTRTTGIKQLLELLHKNVIDETNNFVSQPIEKPIDEPVIIKTTLPEITNAVEEEIVDKTEEVDSRSEEIMKEEKQEAIHKEEPIVSKPGRRVN